MFFGCSLTWGEGCNDDETLPYYAGEYAPHLRPYNYGCPGWGPQNALMLARSVSLQEVIPEAPVYGVYVLGMDHVNRVICSRKRGWTRSFPYFEQTPEDELVYKGPFYRVWPRYTAFMDWTLAVESFDALRIEIPPIRRSHLRRTARLIVELQREFQKQFPESRFAVLVHPVNTYRPHSFQIGELLKDEWSVEVVTVPSESLSNTSIYPCFHPKPAFQRDVAAALVSALGLEVAVEVSEGDVTLSGAPP